MRTTSRADISEQEVARTMNKEQSGVWTPASNPSDAGSSAVETVTGPANPVGELRSLEGPTGQPYFASVGWGILAAVLWLGFGVSLVGTCIDAVWRTDEIGLAAAPAFQLDINRASAAQLQALPEIGTRMADRIVQYRQIHGPFEDAEELMQVHGLGPTTLARLRKFLVVSHQRAGLQPNPMDSVAGRELGSR